MNQQDRQNQQKQRNNQPLTREQQAFAEQHHDLVEAFLNEHGLPHDDYYDVVIFGYLRGVREYLDRADLWQRYFFKEVANRAMKCALTSHMRAQEQPSRRMIVVSLDMLGDYGRYPGVHAVIENPCYQGRRGAYNDGRLADTLRDMLSQEQSSVLRMRANGYSPMEIAKARRSPLQEIEDMLETIRDLADDLLSA